MSIELYTYKFRLEPTRLQQILLSKHIGAGRYVYNHFLNQKKVSYQNYKQTQVDNTQYKLIKYKGSNYNDNARELTLLKLDEDTG